MGSWGVGLYAGDFGADMRGTIRAVSRLPFDAERLAEIVVESEPTSATNPGDEDHTTFWLVLADQFWRRGIASKLATEKALAIIDSGADLDMQRKLGQKEPGLRARARMLAELRAKLTTPPPGKQRPVLRSAQPYLMDVGDAITYPTCGGRPRNPYASDPNQLKIYGPGGGRPWFHDGWGAIVIVDRGRAFGFFAWYRPLVVHPVFGYEEPDMSILERAPWSVELAGTCTSLHFRRMQMRKIGAFNIDPEKRKEALPGLAAGDRQAIGDISIANRMDVRPRPTTVKHLREPYGRSIHLSGLREL
jgi:hypothetical protein